MIPSENLLPIRKSILNSVISKVRRKNSFLDDKGPSFISSQAFKVSRMRFNSVNIQILKDRLLIPKIYKEIKKSIKKASQINKLSKNLQTILINNNGPMIMHSANETVFNRSNLFI